MVTENWPELRFFSFRKKEKILLSFHFINLTSESKKSIYYNDCVQIHLSSSDKDLKKSCYTVYLLV